MARRSKTQARSPQADTDALYEGDAGTFTSRRNELAKRLASEGDREGADAIRALRKPTKVAWAVNQVAHREPKLSKRLLGAGAKLRDSAGAADARRTEREVVGEVVEAARRLAGEDGSPLSDPAAERARKTLHAVALDEEVRDQFSRGVLAEEHEAVGLGPLQASGSGAAKGKGRRGKKAGDDAKRRREAVEAAKTEERVLRRREGDVRRELEQAGQEAERARRALDKAEAALEKATHDADAAAARVKELRDKA